MKLQVNLSSSSLSGVGVSICRGVESVNVVGEDISDVGGAGEGSTKDGVVNTGSGGVVAYV